MSKDRTTYFAQIRDLPIGETLTFSDRLDRQLTIQEVIDSTRGLKQAGYGRFNKTLYRIRQQTDHKYQLVSQIIWDDRVGLLRLTTITREA